MADQEDNGLPQDETKTLVLKRPLKVAGCEITQLTLREPTAGQIRQASNGENAAATVIILASLVCGIPQKSIEDDMLASDYAKVSTFFTGYLRDDRLTGPI